MPWAHADPKRGGAFGGIQGAVRSGVTFWPLVQAAGMAALIAYWIWSGYPASSDADNFWRVDPRHPYGEPWGGPLAFVYSPAFAEVIGPLTRLPWEAFYKVWQGIALVGLAWLLTPIGAAAALLLPFVRADVSGGQIHLWLAVMLAVSVRHPGALSFGLLTKVTPGVSLLWYVARAEWRSLGLALRIAGGVGVWRHSIPPRGLSGSRC